MSLARPFEGEYLPYFGKYIALVPEGDVLTTLRRQFEETRSLLTELSPAQANFRYAPDKWSIKEVVGHMSDGERVFAYRALRAARNDATPVPGFDESAWMPYAPFASGSLEDVLEEFRSVREATLTLLRGVDEAGSLRKVTANGNPVSVRALAYVIAGHERHHVAVLKDRYLNALPR